MRRPAAMGVCLSVGLLAWMATGGCRSAVKEFYEPLVADPACAPMIEIGGGGAGGSSGDGGAGDGGSAVIGGGPSSGGEAGCFAD